MRKYLNSIIIVLSFFLLVGSFFVIKWSYIRQIELETINICQDDELIARLIVKNINPFSKFKYLKKRNSDCQFLLASNRDKALNKQPEEFCSFVDASTNSVLMLVYAYVQELYDRENASIEIKTTINLMTPYNYCNEYFDDIYELIKIKKRFGL